MRLRADRRLLVMVLSATATVCLLVNRAQAMPIVAQYSADGPSYTIGTLTSTIDFSKTGNGEASQLTLGAAYRGLINDAAGSQIRVLQFIDHDDEPGTTFAGTYIGTTTLPSGQIVQNQPVVDVPFNGWSYETLPNGQPGDDTLPFYETNGEKNPVTGQYWAYPDISYSDLHSPDTSVPGYMQTYDYPVLTNPGDQLPITTLYTFEDPNLLGSKTIDVLGGYNWGVQTNSSDIMTGISATDLPYAAITVADVTAWQGALDVSGFSDWTVAADDVILTDVPEPAGWSVLAVSLIGLGFARRKRLRGSQAQTFQLAGP